MTVINSNQKISRRSLTFNKSFLISIFVHAILILGITLTTYYQLPIFKDSPIINVKFANSNEDFFESFAENKETMLLDDVIEGNAFTDSQKGSFQTYKVKKLMANSKVNTEEAVYLNLWQRRIESIGDKIISGNQNSFEGTVQIMATIDTKGNLIRSDILISSGDKTIDTMAIKILNDSAPFAPFNEAMKNEYNFIEIVRDWNFSSF